MESNTIKATFHHNHNENWITCYNDKRGRGSTLFTDCSCQCIEIGLLGVMKIFVGMKYCHPKPVFRSQKWWQFLSAIWTDGLIASRTYPFEFVKGAVGPPVRLALSDCHSSEIWRQVWGDSTPFQRKCLIPRRPILICWRQCSLKKVCSSSPTTVTNDSIFTATMSKCSFYCICLQDIKKFYCSH